MHNLDKNKENERHVPSCWIQQQNKTLREVLNDIRMGHRVLKLQEGKHEGGMNDSVFP